ncbi:MAG: GntG family PLP-dependent aldolase, partial [Armatimonadota bacterium]|nr:GntG family PLP-dependent aldolase [Armatimonadota bacterium]
TVARLEELAAARVGHEAGLFVASGTMGNLVALLTHCGRGDEVIAGERSHTINCEQGGMAALGGIVPRPLANEPDGTLRLDQVAAAVRGDDPHTARTRLLVLENTHNFLGGVPLTVEYTQAAAEVARRHGLRLHLDGARIFNAACALGVSAADLARPADSVTFCLSKGLSAPVGSVLCGSREFVREARRARKVLGGGMRQAGVLAAAGIVALQTMVDRLAEDHQNARRLGEGIAGIPGCRLTFETVWTNMVFFELEATVALDAPTVCRRLESRGVRVLAVGPQHFRAVTHAGVTRAEVEQTVAALRAVLAE